MTTETIGNLINQDDEERKKSLGIIITKRENTIKKLSGHANDIQNRLKNEKKNISEYKQDIKDEILWDIGRMVSENSQQDCIRY